MISLEVDNDFCRSKCLDLKSYVPVPKRSHHSDKDQKSNLKVAEMPRDVISVVHSCLTKIDFLICSSKC